jgi:hypothetical protein
VTPVAWMPFCVALRSPWARARDANASSESCRECLRSGALFPPWAAVGTQAGEHGHVLEHSVREGAEDRAVVPRAQRRALAADNARPSYNAHAAYNASCLAHHVARIGGRWHRTPHAPVAPHARAVLLWYS